MGTRRKILLLFFGIIFFTCLARASDEFLIQIHLFQGTIENQPPLKQAEVLSTSSNPEFSSLKDKVTGSESELTAAAIDFLLELYGMQTIEDLFLHEKPWNGLGKPFLDDFIFGSQASYQIKLRPKMLSSQQIALSAVILKTKKRGIVGDWETLIDQELVLELGNPVIVSVPYKGQAYFMMVLITTGSPREISVRPEKAKKIHFVSELKAVTQVQPFYPEELRRRQIGGEIGLRITIDEKGNVQRVDIVNPLHPYLNYTAVQAFRQWTFEPARLKGKPVRAAFRYTYDFNPWLYKQEIAGRDTVSASDASSQEELLRVLGGAGEYCQRLAGAIMDFVCEETIRETHYDLLKNIRWSYWVFGRGKDKAASAYQYSLRILSLVPELREIQTEEIRPREIARFQIMDPKKTQSNNFLCDYQIIKKAGAVKERRIILKENSREIADKKKLLEEKRFTGLSALFAPLRVLARDRQSRFNYKIIDKDKIHRKRAYVIEALPKSGNEDGVWSARIWVDMKSFQILKCEIEGIPIDGYEDVLNDCAILNIKPIFQTAHEYRIEKKGVLFPARSSVRVAYPGIDYRGAIVKIKAKMAYDKYKFFTVETEHKVIK
jgi:TonB family protein